MTTKRLYLDDVVVGIGDLQVGEKRGARLRQGDGRMQQRSPKPRHCASR
jgi:hypothetical protein